MGLFDERYNLNVIIEFLADRTFSPEWLTAMIIKSKAQNARQQRLTERCVVAEHLIFLIVDVGHGKNFAA